MEKKLNPRVIKTRSIIKKNFFALMEEVGFQKISVRSLVKRAEINRSTFYLHYLDKYQLLESIEEELLLGMKKIAMEALIPWQGFGEQQLMPMIERMANYIYENNRTFSLLIGERGDPAFIEKFGELVKSVWFEKKMVEMLTIPQNYALAAVIGMLTNLISEWLKNGLQESPAEFVAIVAKIVKNIPNNIFAPQH